MKRLFDVVLALFAGTLLLLPILLVAVMVRATSPGPALYWSDRVGRDNRIFRMPKFRTMRVGTPAVATHLLQTPSAYLTTIGPFLRSSSLDELPQLWSILVGDMSFVGPRPALFNQDDLIELRTRAGVHRLLPGLTGWAQINGRDDLPIPEKVQLDAEYLQRRSLALDLRIIATSPTDAQPVIDAVVESAKRLSNSTDATLTIREGDVMRYVAISFSSGTPLFRRVGQTVSMSRPGVGQTAILEGRTIVQWDKDSCGDAGFLKIDLLGLGMLSAVEECVTEVARATGEVVDLSRIPLDDPATYADIRVADTVGVFQIESRAQMQMLLRTQPRCLDDLVVEVALVRPGPIQGGAVHPFVERLQLSRADPSFAVPYDHPLLAEALRETLGVIVFQDQVLDVAIALAGFTIGEAEGLRRAMSRKRSLAALESHRLRFVEGAIANGVTPGRPHRLGVCISGRGRGR